MIFKAYLSLLFLQFLSLALFAWLSKIFPQIKDGLWAFGRYITWLVLSLIIFFLAYLKLPVNNGLGIYFLLFIFLLVNLYFLFFSKKSKKILKLLKNYWRQFRRQIIIEELIFLIFFIFLLFVRSFQPEILGLEKYMDAGFIQAYLKSATLPASDIWLAGESINYYSFGHFMGSILVQIWQIDLAWAYNFLLATIMALLASSVFSLTFNIRANFTWGEKHGKDFSSKEKYNFSAAVWTAILASLLVTLFGNGHSLWYFLSNGNFAGYWYPNATRFIERTIHEYPVYSFVVSDLHAHVFSMPMVIAMLMSIFLWLSELIEEVKRQKVLRLLAERFFLLSLVMGIFIGSLAMTNTWDVLVYASLLLILGIFLLIWRKEFFLPLLSSAIGLSVTAAIISAPWFLTFQSIAEGIQLANEHSPFWQLLVLWGAHFIPVLIFIVLLLINKKQRVKKEEASWFFVVAMFFAFIFLLVFTELFYFKDIYTGHPRSNTMFKLMFQGFIWIAILLSLAISLFISKTKTGNWFKWQLINLREVLSQKNKKLLKVKIFLRTCLFVYLPIALLIIGLATYPYLAFRSYYGDFKNYQGLNGMQWMLKRYPSSYAMVNYLKEKEAQQVNILEASGESFTEFSLISAFSGMPTILGWQVHEWLWRGSWDVSAQRLGEIDEIYNNPNSIVSRKLLEQYQVKYLIITNREREKHPNLDEAALLGLGKLVWTGSEDEINQDYLILLEK
ncbi:MAG: hypothetical protein GX943_00390 [Candidatus Pacebacteria bacterium]|nr:hypothetical protein [Candidatus Paceibacterota bacterium]